MTEEKKQSLHPISKSLCRTYNLLQEKREVFFALKDASIDKLDTIVKTIYGTYFGFTRFPTDEDKAVGFFCLIIKDHPVTDGYKRLALLWLEILCDACGLKMNLEKISLDKLAVSIEQEKNMDNDQLFATVKSILFS